MGFDPAVNEEESGGGELLGTVIELLASAKCRVELENRKRIVAHPGPASKSNFVRLRPGDQVAVILSPRDETRGRIVRLIEAQVRGRDRGVL
ncbi:MAG: translation initiation factor IF-1 [Bryobacteraceae bacterium]